jgi:hypothetical protein
MQVSVVRFRPWAPTTNRPTPKISSAMAAAIPSP